MSEVHVMALNSVQFVVGKDGQPVAVQVDLGLWRQILAALEDADDIALAQAALAELRSAGGDPEQAGWVSLDSLRDSWRDDAEV